MDKETAKDLIESWLITAMYETGALDNERYQTVREALSLILGAGRDPVTQLYPCGCGGQAVIMGIAGSTESHADGGGKAMFHVRCTDCDMRSGSYDVYVKAQKAWNLTLRGETK